MKAANFSWNIFEQVVNTVSRGDPSNKSDHDVLAKVVQIIILSTTRLVIPQCDVDDPDIRVEPKDNVSAPSV